MLRTAFKDLKELLDTPGLWLVSTFVNTINLITDAAHFHLFSMCGDTLLIFASIIFYLMSKRGPK